MSQRLIICVWGTTCCSKWLVLINCIAKFIYRINYRESDFEDYFKDIPWFFNGTFTMTTCQDNGQSFIYCQHFFILICWYVKTHNVWTGLKFSCNNYVIFNRLLWFFYILMHINFSFLLFLKVFQHVKVFFAIIT